MHWRNVLLTVIRSSKRSPLQTLLSMKETICLRIKCVIWWLLGMLPGPAPVPKRFRRFKLEPECLEAQLRKAKLQRLRAERKLADTRKLAAEVRDVVNLCTDR